MPARLPNFTHLEITTFADKLDTLLKDNLQQIDTIVNQNVPFHWDNLMQPLDTIRDTLQQLWSPLEHLHAVVNSPALRDCYKACLPKLSAYESAIGQNKALYKALSSLDKKLLNPAQIKLIDDALRDFELSGVALSTEKKQRFEYIDAKLAELSNQFENNILDATQAFSVHITDEHRLIGLPEHALRTAKALAEEKKLPGWVLNLEYPCYLAVITYACDRSLRETLYHAFVTRASDQGPSAGQFDNSSIMNEMLSLRHEQAQLLDFDNFAEYSIATKMAPSTKDVIDFLMDLSQRAHSQAQKEFQQLQAFAKQAEQIEDLAPWDIAYMAEKMCQRDFDFSQEDLRPYFPQDQVMSGLFTIINRLYGIKFEKVTGADVWHPDVMCYQLWDENDEERGYVYIDLYARPNKRGGAWMDILQTRRRLENGHIQLPIATLTCNFAKPAEGRPATFSHDEVLTLFHEFGHCLHHLLTRVDYLNASGINGVEWDAVELPSQFFENWCWEEAALLELTRHVNTGGNLPKSLLNKVIAAKHFQSAMMMMRQLEFSLFDFRIHREYDSKEQHFIQNILAQVRQHTCVTPLVDYNRFQHSFAHIFSGGYAAGYYSYKWAEVLSCDAYSRFEEEGIFNEQTGRDFLHCILEVGSTKNALDAFIAFRARPPRVDALLRHTGIVT